MTGVGTWVGMEKAAKPSGEQIALPRIFCYRHQFWHPLFATVDNTASHPVVWDFLASLVHALKPKVIVEAGTYQGHAAFAMGEALRMDKSEGGHIFTADVEDHGIMDVVKYASLEPYISFFHGRYEAMLEQVTQPIDLAFIDASETENGRLRLDYVELTLPRLSQHGIIVVDDATDDEWPGAKMLRDQCSLFLPTGRGLALFQAKA